MLGCYELLIGQTVFVTGTTDEKSISGRSAHKKNDPGDSCYLKHNISSGKEVLYGQKI